MSTPQAIVAELVEYVGSDEFKVKCADVFARQNDGEDFTIEQLAIALGIPVELANHWLQQRAEAMLARIVVPETSGAPN